MWPYFILFALVVFSYCVLSMSYSRGKTIRIKGIEKEKSFLNIAFFYIIVLSGLRAPSVGPDTIQYIRHFNRTVGDKLIYLDKQFEEGYGIFVKLVSFFTDEPQVLLIIAAILINIPILKFIQKYSKDKFLSVILYIAVGSFTFQLTGIRQAIAMSICVLAIDYAMQRKAFKFIALVLLAVTFHRSAVMFLPVYLLGSRGLNKKRAFLVLAGCATLIMSGFLFLNFANLLGYQEYIGDIRVEDGGGWTYVVMMVISIVLYFLSNRDTEGEGLPKGSKEIDDFFFAVMVFALVTYLMRYEFRVAERISIYYRMALIILLPNALTEIKGTNIRVFAKAACFILSIALFFYWMNGSNYLYSFFWE